MAEILKGYSLDSNELLNSLVATERLLIIQDLDGVCMGLVRDPLTRTIGPGYVQAAAQLAGHFYVLTNGEHIGSRGVNTLVDSALQSASLAGEQGLYLPGLAAGGVQLQNSFGHVSHPGVSAGELQFLQRVPDQAAKFLRELLLAAPYALDAHVVEQLIASTVLDNLASPTVNINGLYQHLKHSPALYQSLQTAVAGFMHRLHDEAVESGLSGSFFTHFAPNSGRDEQGQERLKLSIEGSAGTTDFQFMLSGAIKEVGVLVILNHYYFAQTGDYPLGADFNPRQVPHAPADLVEMVRANFDPALMPRIVGVGDTLTSHADIQAGQLRGGSDRGFLTVVQALGEAFGCDNRVVYVDSSGDEVQRPGVDAALLQCRVTEPTLAPWAALENISDAQDPLRLDVIFSAGYRQYVSFFCELAQRHSERWRATNA